MGPQKPCRIQTMGDKVLSREGKSPDRYLRSLNNSLVVKGCDKVNTTRRWAWKQPSLEEIVIDHWSRINVFKLYRAENVRGSSYLPKERASLGPWPKDAVTERSVSIKV